MDEREVTEREIVTELEDLAAAASDPVGVFEAWPRLVRASARAIRQHGPAGRALLRGHPILAIARESPATSHSRAQPRGYAGDARLIDLLQNCCRCLQPEALEASTPRGRAILSWTQGSGGAQAVRECHALVASLIDETAERVDDAHVLSVTAGHLWEACLALHAKSIGRWVAMDEDMETVDELAESHAELPSLVAVHRGIRRLIARPMTHGTFDFAHAIWLTADMDPATVEALALAMFRSLRSGGRMLLACLDKSLPEAGYMDAVMGWQPPMLETAGCGGSWMWSRVGRASASARSMASMGA